MNELYEEGLESAKMFSKSIAAISELPLEAMVAVLISPDFNEGIRIMNDIRDRIEIAKKSFYN